MIPPIIEAIGNAFIGIINALGDFFVKIVAVSTPGVILGIMGLAGAFWLLASALSTLSLAGLGALPVLAAVSGIGIGLAAVGFGLGALTGNNKKEEETNKYLKNIDTNINNIIEAMNKLAGKNIVVKQETPLISE